jgi:phage recombination protein Bet
MHTASQVKDALVAAVRTGAALTPLPEVSPPQKLELSDEKIELLKQTVAVGASNAELELFVHVCNRTQLDPFARQIWAVKRRSKNEQTQQWEERMTFQTSVDGLRLVAQRSGEYLGQTEPELFDAAGNVRTVWIDTKPPAAARVGVFRRGFAQPMYATAIWKEFVQVTSKGEVTKMWREKPTVMIAKCAESLALRKAFPMELSGLYSQEEMAAADNEDELEQGAATRQTQAKVVQAGDARGATVRVDSDGLVRVTFGKFHDEPLINLPSADLRRLFQKPWMDAARRQTAVERFGQGFVSAVYGEIERRLEANDPVFTGEPAGD